MYKLTLAYSNSVHMQYGEKGEHTASISYRDRGDRKVLDGVYYNWIGGVAPNLSPEVLAQALALVSTTEEAEETPEEEVARLDAEEMEASRFDAEEENAWEARREL